MENFSIVIRQTPGRTDLCFDVLDNATLCGMVWCKTPGEWHVTTARYHAVENNKQRALWLAVDDALEHHWHSAS